jgi:very-short-patch-repair endonuclease
MRPIRTDQARHLRKNMNGAERRLWSRLRARQVGGWKFRRQHPIGAYIVDYVCLAARLVIELDGPTHRGVTFGRDQRRQAWLEAEGYAVLRFSADFKVDYLNDVIRTISLELTKRSAEVPAWASPTRRAREASGPTSPPSGEGESP